MKDPKEVVAARLVALLDALGVHAAVLCRQIGIHPNRWSQYATAERELTLDVATRLKERYGATLDWLYMGDESGLPQRIIEKLNPPMMPPPKAPSGKPAKGPRAPH